MRTYARIAIAGVAGLIAVGALAGCSSSSNGTTPTPTASSSTAPNVVAPVTVNLDSSLDGKSIDVPLGSNVDLLAPTGTEDQWTVDNVSDPSIVAFASGGTMDGVTYNPGIFTVAKGTSKVTLAGPDGAKYTFTVNVTQ